MAEQPPEPLPELPLASPPLPEGAPPAPEPARPAVVALLADLFFAPHFAHVIRTQGGAPLLVDTADALVQAVDRHFPVLALVDLAAPGDWAAALRRLKLRPTTRALPVYAFGAHVDAPALRAARAAGADHAWARSRLLAELPALVARAIAPAVVYPEGWDAPLPAAARLGVAAFNRGAYFDQHEHFEHAWLAEARPVREMYQGILQVGVALLHIERNNWTGALKLLRRGLPRLRNLPPVCQGIDIAALRSAAEAIHAELVALGPQRLHEFDRSRFPQIVMAAADDSK